MFFAVPAPKPRSAISRGYQPEPQSLTFTSLKCLEFCNSSESVSRKGAKRTQRTQRKLCGLMAYNRRHVLLKTRPVRIADLQNSCPDQVATPVFQILVPDRHDLHLHWSARQFQLHVQLSVGPGEVVLTDSYGRANQSQPRATDGQRVPVKRRQTPRSVRTHARIRQAQSERQTRPHTLTVPPVSDKTAQLRHDSAGQLRHLSKPLERFSDHLRRAREKPRRGQGKGHSKKTARTDAIL